MNQKIKLTFVSGAGTVTGANFLVETPSFKFLVDCGLLQGVPGADSLNAKPFPYDPNTIDYLFITHSHMDHIGLVPKLVKEGFRGKIYSTAITKDISEAMFEDALGLIDQASRRDGVLPIYDKSDVELAMSLWHGLSYHNTFNLPDDWQLYIKDSGHILGSAMFEFSHNKRKLVFTGDLGNTPTPLLRDTEAITSANYMIMESVYGDRNHESPERRDALFLDMIKRGLKRGGTILIPAFSLERSQVILYELNKMVEKGLIPSVPVFLDSPLAIKITEIYKNHTKEFNQGVRQEIASGDDIFKFPKLHFTIHTNESRQIEKTPNPKIIMAGGGMSQGGRVLGHEKKVLPDNRSTVILVGYQALGTLGREIADGAKGVMIEDEKVPIRAKIEMIQGFSSHKDSDHLVDFVANTAFHLNKLFVVMGEPKSGLFLVQRVREYLGVDAVFPEKGEVVTLEM